VTAEPIGGRSDGLSSMIFESCGNPGDLEDVVALQNGRLLWIRPMRRGESDRIRALYSRLSLRSRYLRFLCAMPVLPDPVLEALTCVDDRRLALVAELDPGGADVVALANFCATADGTAELAVVVRDDCQGQGIGTALVCKLLEADLSFIRRLR